MKIYIAGKLGTQDERNRLEEIDKMCKLLGFDTFLPHRDVGIAASFKDRKSVFDKDIFDGLEKCDFVIASLDGLHVGAGTAWELGYAYAKGIKAVGIKSDESPEEGFEYLSSIITASLKIVSTLEDLQNELLKIT